MRGQSQKKTRRAARLAYWFGGGLEWTRVDERIARAFEANIARNHAEKKMRFSNLSELSLDELRQLHEDMFDDKDAARDFVMRAYREKLEAAAMSGDDSPVT